MCLNSSAYRNTFSNSLHTFFVFFILRFYIWVIWAYSLLSQCVIIFSLCNYSRIVLLYFVQQGENSTGETTTITVGVWLSVGDNAITDSCDGSVCLWGSALTRSTDPTACLPYTDRTTQGPYPDPPLRGHRHKVKRLPVSENRTQLGV